MSIFKKIQELEGVKDVVAYRPAAHLASKRRLYLSSDAIADFNNSQSAVNLLVGRGYVAAAMTRWVTGGRIYGDKKRGRFLDRLDPPPPDIWEIRVTEPITQARLIGRFAAQDTLILTKFHTRRLLGPKGSADWAAAMSACVAAWDKLFSGYGPHTGTTIDQFVTENCDDFPI